MVICGDGSVTVLSYLHLSLSLALKTRRTVWNKINGHESVQGGNDWYIVETFHQA